MAANTSRNTLALNRTQAVIGTVTVALVVNLVIWLIGLAAGADYVFHDDMDVERKAAPVGVILLTVVPAAIGLVLAALLSLRWPLFVRIAQAVGPILAIVTIALTLDADFDTASTVSLAAMHVALAVVLFAGLEAMHRGIARP